MKRLFSMNSYDKDGQRLFQSFRVSRTDRGGIMVSELQATDIPVNRVDVLHVLALNGDDLSLLSYSQKIAIRNLYFLDDDRTVEKRIRDGDLAPVTQEDVREFNGVPP
jgi:hypothetical protein